jgi:hypothetical protein
MSTFSPLPRTSLAARNAAAALARAARWITFLLAAGCEGDGPRVYTAQPFDATAMCLADYEPIGLVMATELPGTCDPVCLRLDTVLYLSTVCKPYPDTVVEETPDDSEECAAALMSLETEAFCQ